MLIKSLSLIYQTNQKTQKMSTFQKLSDLTKRLESLKKLSSSLTTKYKNDEIDIDTYQNDLESFKWEINICKLEIISIISSL